MKTDKKGRAEFNQAASEICELFCKWKMIWRETGSSMTEEVCGKCPLVRLEKGMKVE